MAKLSYISSDDRKYNMGRVLSLIKSDVLGQIQNSTNIVVKPSCMSDNLQLASTHADALEALFEFISPYAKNQIILADGCSKGDTMNAFRNYGYFKVQDSFDFAIVDLNKDEIVDFPKSNASDSIKIAKTIAEADCIISICPPRTDNTVLYSGAVKNIFEGAVPKYRSTFSSRFSESFHRNTPPNDSQAQIDFASDSFAYAYNSLPYVLALIDGYSALQSEASIYEGEMVSSHWAIASTDAVFADYLSCQLLGIESSNVAYLDNLIDPDHKNQIIVGDDWKKRVIKIKTPKNFQP